MARHRATCHDAPVPDQSPQIDSVTIAAELIAVIAAVTKGEPRVLTIADGDLLPSGPFVSAHRSLQSGMRSWVEEQTHHPLGYVEQLYTFADPHRTDWATRRVVSISYLGLTREARSPPTPGVGWHSWYEYFPWEDHRRGAAALVEARLAPPLRAWAESAASPSEKRARRQRVAINFGLDGERWNEDLVLQRYETLWEARLAPESGGETGLPGQRMRHDHRRILATGIARLRAKIKYRPVVFELMPPAFTLLQLQRAVEALAGRLLHKQNFRRLIDQQDLVEETGAVTTETGGRPAKLFRFRGEVLAERAVAGTKLPLVRGV
jgi:hypothetical protein